MYVIPDVYKPFLNSVKRKCKYHKVNLIFSPSKRVVDLDYFNSECSGYFCSESKRLVVAIGKPVDEWMQILVHESSHMDQWLGGGIWNESNGKDYNFWEWLVGNKMMNKKQISSAIDYLISIEHDCDKRAVEKIKKWKLPVNITEYIKKANVYAYSYNLIPEYRKFPTGIYNNRELINVAPASFQKDYRVIPKDLEAELHKFFENNV